MNLSDVVDFMAERTGRPRSEADRMARAMLDAIRQGLKEDGKVDVTAFGSLEVRRNLPRRARNFATGESIMAAGKTTVRFKPSRSILTGTPHPFDWRTKAATPLT